MFCKPSYTDKINRIAAPSKGGVTPIFDRLALRRKITPDVSGLGAVDWGALVNAIPGVLETSAKVYGQIESGKYNPIATYNLPYGVTPSATGISWSGAINPSTQWGTNPLLPSVVPYLLAAGGVLAAVLLMRR